MNEVRHDWMASELDRCDGDERAIRLAELCGCGHLDPVELERVIAARETERTREMDQNQCVSVLSLARALRREAEPRVTGGRRAA